MFRKWGLTVVLLLGSLTAASAAVARNHVSIGVYGPGYGISWAGCRHCSGGYYTNYYSGYYAPDYDVDYYPTYRPVVYYPSYRPVYRPVYRHYYRDHDRDRYYDRGYHRRDYDYYRRDRGYRH